MSGLLKGMCLGSYRGPRGRRGVYDQGTPVHPVGCGRSRGCGCLTILLKIILVYTYRGTSDVDESIWALRTRKGAKVEVAQ